MNADSLIRLSVKQFKKLTGWPTPKIISGCKSGELSFKCVGDSPKQEILIHVKNLPDTLLERHFSNEIIKDEQQNAALLMTRKNINTIKYNHMKPYQQKHVDKWLPIMLGVDILNLKGEKLRGYCTNKKITYSTCRRHLKKWRISGGDFDSLKTRYGNRLGKKSSKKASWAVQFHLQNR